MTPFLFFMLTQQLVENDDGDDEDEDENNCDSSNESFNGSGSRSMIRATISKNGF